MATGVESSSPETGMNAVVLDFPVTDTSSPSRIPRRLKKRLLEPKTPSTVEEIEAKLRHADLRRQEFYEKLSSKARHKPRSPSRSSSNEDDLGQRLEAKLQAAEQKRQRILANAQMRLARLDELRQAAKSAVEMRSEREREKLVTKVELRVQQAEANRMLILKAYRQRRATLRERSSQSLMRRMAWESKYKERVHAAIHQKRVAAERKRLGFLEAEKKRAHARLLQVRRVAKSVSHQREIERRRIREQLENRLQKAKSQRAEYLSKRRRQRNSVQVNWNRMREQADFLSRKLARCWRQFLRSRRTTIDLAKDYDLLNINESSIKSMPFEQLALLIESAATLRTVKSLLDRLESRFRVSKVVDRNNSVSLENIDHLLKRVATPKKRTTPRTSVRNREAKRVAVAKGVARTPVKLSRYPVRIVLCAYMILGHPDAVLSGEGEREVCLARSAEEFVQQFELLLRIILDGPIQSSDEESDSMVPRRCTFRSQLATFDKAFCSYLNSFVVWKVKDAQSLEDDLVRAACQLELSMIKKCKLTPGGDNGALSHDMKAIQKQVMEDQKLFKEKIQHLSGYAGIERMECALSETRSRYFEAMENGSTVGSPILHLLSPITSSPSASPPVATLSDGGDMTNGSERPSRVVRSLFKEDDASSYKGVSSPANTVGHIDDLLGSSVDKLATENELIVNEFLHEQDLSFVDRRLSTDGDNGIKAKIRETMEVAFWDTIMESLKQAEPNYDRVVDLVREVRDGITEMAPKSWKKEIAEAIDVDILSQVLESGTLDMDYLKKILDFALCTLQKLCSPAHEEELKVMHQKLLKELAETCQTQDEVKCSHATAMIKGLRFVLEQIQTLKQEISQARIRMMEPLLKGPAGFDYLRKAFTNSYGSYSDACARLPLTMQWLSSVKNCKDQEWEEHINCLSALTNHENSSQVFLPSASLRTGGNFMLKTNGSVASTSSVSNASGGKKPQPECNGDKIDLFVRLGLLKLSGLAQETFPETLVLNAPRLRAGQAQIQKIVVISTSLLVCRQALLMERAVASMTDMETAISKCTQRLLEVLDQLDEVGIEVIVDIISSFDDKIDSDKLQSRKAVMSRMLGKSLQAGDPIFEKVSRAVYLAVRGVVLGGSGIKGRSLAEMALRQVGAVTLTEKVVETAEVIMVAASVSVKVHGPWYANLIDNM